MRDKRSWLRLAASTCVIWLLVACGGAPAAGPGENVAAELEGTEWRLAEYGPADAPVAARPEPPITIKFEADGRIGGSGGCNSYGGTYELDGQSLKLGQIQSTLMACADAAVTQQESVYLAALGSATTLQRSGDELTMGYDGGQLRFTRIQPAG